MSNGILVNPVITINGSIFKVVPNSVSLQVGRGAKTVNTEAAGSVLNPVVSDNLENAVGQLKFSLYVTSDNYNGMEAVRANIGQNIVQVGIDASDKQDSLSVTSAFSTVTDEVEYNFKSEGQADFTMQGSQFL